MRTSFNSLLMGFLMVISMLKTFKASSQLLCGNAAVTFSTQNPSKVGYADGSYTVTISGGPGDYTVITQTADECEPDDLLCLIYGGEYCEYHKCRFGHNFHLDSNQTSASYTVSNLYAYSYDVHVIRTNQGCDTTFQITLNDPPCSLQLATSNKINASTPTAADGSISIQVSGAQGPAKVFLSTNNFLQGSVLIDSTYDANHTFQNLKKGSYLLEVHDTLLCSQFVSFEITGGNCNLQPTVTIIPPSYKSYQDGAITINATGGIGMTKVGIPEFLSLSHVQPVPATYGLLSGNKLYNFEIFDEGGCQYFIDTLIPDGPCNYHPSLSTTPAINGSGGKISISTNSTFTIFSLIKNQSGSVIDSSYFQNAHTAMNLAPGDYTVYSAEVIIDDLFGLVDVTVVCDNTSTLHINNVVDCNNLQGNLTHTDATTYHGTDGTIHVNITGGSAGSIAILNGNCQPEIFNINSNASGFRSKWSMAGDTIFGSGTFTGLPAGSYHVCIIDGTCRNIEYANINTPNCQFTSHISFTNPSANHSDGSISVIGSVSGSNEDVRIFVNNSNANINSGFNNLTTYNLAEGTYYISQYGSDPNHCYRVDTITLDDGLDCNITFGAISTTGVSVYGAQDGTISVSATSTHGHVTLSAGGHSILDGGTISGLSPGAYNVTAVDEAGCTLSTGAYYIPTPRCGLQDGISVKLPTGGFDGEINVNPTGVSDTMFISVQVPSIIGFITIASGFNHLSVKNLSAGYYNVTVYTRDYQNCSAGKSITLYNAPCNIHAFAFGYDASGPNTNDGYIIAGASNSVSTFTLSGPGTKTNYNTFSGLGPGTYTITASDDLGGCTSTASVTISAPSCFQLGVFKSEVTVYGGTDGTANAYISSGASNGYDISYSLYKNGSLITTLQNISYFSGLSAGDYTISANDHKGCASSVDFTILQPQCTFDTVIVRTHLSLHGASDGKIKVTAVGGLGNVNVQLQSQLSAIQQTSLSPAIFDHLPAGIYRVIVFDEVTCRDSFNVQLNEPACDVHTLTTHKNVSVHNGQDGQVFAFASHGIAPYLFELKKNNLIVSTKISTDSINFNNLFAGTYILTTTDGSSCLLRDTIIITEPQCSNVNNTVTVTACNSFNYHGTNYTASGDYTVTLSKTDGCDSIITLHLIIHQNTSYETTVTACDSYLFNGVTFASSGNYVDHKTNVAGCDSVITLHLTILHSSNSSTTVTACNQYAWNGMIFSESGDYTKTLINAAGCDSIATLHLTIAHSVTNEINLSACDSLIWNGMTLTMSGTYTKTFSLASGCDSILTLHLTIHPSSQSMTKITACENYSWNGMMYSASGHYNKKFTNAVGCDSTAYLDLIILHSVVTQINASACNSYTYNGTSYTASGDYSFTYTSTNGCDSTVFLHLVIYNNSITVVNINSCDSLIWNGTKYTASGDYVKILQNSYGCDSLVTLHLNIDYSVTHSISMTACDSLLWNGMKIMTSGDYIKKLTTSTGCDSIVTLHALIYHGTSYTASITTCESFTWEGVTYTSSGNYVSHKTNAAGCDSMITLHLTILHSSTSLTTITACNQYAWNGMIFSESGDYTKTLVNSKGCDSIATLHLIIAHSVANEINLSACDSLIWNGMTLTMSGTYTKTFSLASGCDSILTLHLTIHPSPQSMTKITACENYTWNGVTYSASGHYNKKFPNAGGCDSTAFLDLIILRSVITQLNASTCNSYTFQGINYTASGDYSFIYTGSNGCDSTVRLHLEIYKNTSSDVYINSCDSLIWNGTKYTASGNYVKILQNSHGCDSLVTLHLTISFSVNDSVSLTACDSLLWNGMKIITSGDYIKKLTTSTGCDSIVTLHATINHSTAHTSTISACGSYMWAAPLGDGLIHTTSGIFKNTSLNSEGCSHIETLTLTIQTTANAGIISGSNSVCVHAAIQLKDSIAGGTWSSSNPALAIVDNSGLVTGVASGTDTILYTVVGCGTAIAFKIITINPLPNPGIISGINTLCVGANANVTESITGGVWSTSNASIATINIAGRVHGVAPGIDTIFYSVSNGCGTVRAMYTITILGPAMAGTISGQSPMCIGSTFNFTTTGTSGGKWSSNNTAVAIVDSITGKVTAISNGSTSILYRVSNQCNANVSQTSRTVVVTTNVSAGIINGISPICVGSTSTFKRTGGTAGGTWSSSNPAVASVSSNAIATALSPGTAFITYTVVNGCGAPVSSYDTLIVNGVIKPVVTCPSSPAVRYTSTSCTYRNNNNLLNAVASALCGVPTLSYTMSGSTTGSGSTLNNAVLNKGTSLVTWTASNSAGSASCTLIIQVLDTIPPTLSCPGNIIDSIKNSSRCSTNISIPNPRNSDNCGLATLKYTMSGATTFTSPLTGINLVGTKTFNVGTSTIAYTAVDSTGNATTCTFTVTVKSARCFSGLTDETNQLLSARQLTDMTVHAHPNPFNRYIQLEIRSESQNMIQISVMNVNGQTVYHTTGAANEIFQFGNEFPAGIYMARIMQGQQIKTIRIIKQN